MTMSAIREQFEERIGRAVSRFAHHAAGEGMDVNDLGGRVTLILDDGQLKGVEYEAQPEASTPATKAAKSK